MKKEARRSAHVNWTEIFGAIIVAIVGPLVVLITRKYWQDLQADQKYILTYGKEVAIRACSGNYVMADVNDQNILVARERHGKSWKVFKLVLATSPFSTFPTRPVR